MVDDIIISGLLEQTAQAHRVIVFDRPGFGHSERPRGGLVLASGYYYREPRADVMLPSAAATPVLGDVICHTAGPLLGEVMTSAVLRKMFAPTPRTPRI
jgi:pimeloyl-ACP methyl ester carboxylesterase